MDFFWRKKVIKAFMAMSAPVLSEKYSNEIEKARRDLRALISTKKCAPIMLLLAWQDAGTYDAIKKTGGPNGSIRNKEEYMNASNTDLKTAIDLCEEVKAKHPIVTYADLYQLAGVVAVELTGGPTVDFAPGRKDSNKSPNEGLVLPDADQGPSDFIDAFYKMGLSDKDIVALSGAYMTLGGFDEKPSFTKEPMEFNNSYFVELLNVESLELLMPDNSLLDHPNFRCYVQLYAKDEEAFFKDYAESHKKLSELGFTPPLSKRASLEAEGVRNIVLASSIAFMSFTLLLIAYILEINKEC